MTGRRWIGAIILIFGLGIVATWPAKAKAPLSVYAAASTREAVSRVLALCPSRGLVCRAVLAGSSTLARQIEAGAPATLFLSANALWMDYLDTRDLLAQGTRTALAGNRLVVVAPRGTRVPSDFHVSSLPAFLGSGRLAMGDPDHVPAGIYAKAALQALGLWSGVDRHVLRMAHVRSALAVVDAGQATAGLVYETDLRLAPGLVRVARLPADSHPRIVYSIALVRSEDNRDARTLLRFFQSPAAAEIFRRHGFSAPRGSEQAQRTGK